MTATKLGGRSMEASRINRTPGLKSLSALVGLSLIVGLGLVGPATAEAAPPVIYDQSRALPTRGGVNVKIVVFTKRATKVKIRVDGKSAVRATRFGRGCGALRCDKWRIYTRRSGNECYELKVTGRHGPRVGRRAVTVCEPFRDGAV